MKIIALILTIIITTTKSDNSTISCPRNHFVQKSNECKACPEGSNSTEGYCICTSENHYFNIKQWKCIECSNETSGVDASNTTCKCENETMYFNMDTNTCDTIEYPPCSKLQYYDKDTHRCVICQSGNSEGGFSEKCSCNSNQFWHTGLSPKKCYTCGTGTASEDGLFCDCKDSTKFWNNNTFQCEVCPSGSSKYSTESNNKYATQCNCSAEDEIFDLNTVTCRQCPSNSAKMENSESALAYTCICTDTNLYFDIDEFKCVSCPSNSDRSSNENGNVCECKREYATNEYLNGKCVKCPSYSSYNIDSKECVCEDGYVFNPKQFVCEKCPEGASSENGTCVCSSGYLIDGYCKECPSDSAYNNDTKTCVCQNEGYYYNSSSNECITCASDSADMVYAYSCVYCDGDEFSEGKSEYCECKSSKFYWDADNKYCVRYGGRAYSQSKHIAKSTFFITLILFLIY